MKKYIVSAKPFQHSNEVHSAWVELRPKDGVDQCYKEVIDALRKFFQGRSYYVLPHYDSTVAMGKALVVAYLAPESVVEWCVKHGYFAEANIEIHGEIEPYTVAQIADNRPTNVLINGCPNCNVMAELAMGVHPANHGVRGTDTLDEIRSRFPCVRFHYGTSCIEVELKHLRGM